MGRNAVVLLERGYDTSTSLGVLVYLPASDGTHHAYSQRDGQAELTILHL